MAVGLMSAGIGSVPAAQTWIDIGQGARLNASLYDEPLPPLYVDPGAGGAPPHVPTALWQRVRDRAEAAPADLVPGLLGTTLRRGRVAADADQPAGPAAAILVDAKGAIVEGRQCRQRACARVGVLTADLGRLRALAASPPWRRPADRDRAAAPRSGPSARGRRGGRGLRRHAQLGFDADARLRALHRHRPHDPRAPRAPGPRRDERRADRGHRGGRPGLRGAARGPPGGGRAPPWPRDRRQPADLGRARGARRSRLRGRVACARRCPCSRSRSPICRRCCC